MYELFEILGKKQAFTILAYLHRHPYSTASELAAALGIHIATAQKYLEGMTEGGILQARERPSKPRTAWEYWLPETKIRLEIDVEALVKAEENRKGASGRLATLFIREKARPDVAFEWDDSGKRITAVLFFKKGLRRRLERKLGFSKEEGRFLWHVPFQSEKFRNVAEVLSEAGLELEEGQVLRMVDRFKSLGIVTVEKEVMQ